MDKLIDIIGSLDDKIENNNKIIEKVTKLGELKYTSLPENKSLLINEVDFKKGKEASAQNYFTAPNKNTVNYIRVKDLNGLTDTFISKDLDIPFANNNDILISFDGAIGRLNFGLTGAYSSGIYKVIPNNNKIYGIYYWCLKNNKNQQIMLEHTNGTTILHGSKSINYLEIKSHSQTDDKYFNELFDYIKQLKLENINLSLLKNKYLQKFFN